MPNIQKVTLPSNDEVGRIKYKCQIQFRRTLRSLSRWSPGTNAVQVRGAILRTLETFEGWQLTVESL